MLGQSAHLGCDYNLGNSSLYSVKWYKNGQEFFRFMPSMSRSFEVFHVSGVNLDVSDRSKLKDKAIFCQLVYSGNKRIYLVNINQESEGVYR